MTFGVRTVAVLVLSVVTAPAVFIGTVFAATTVSPSNMHGWAFEVQSPDGSGTFVSGPATPPLGTGSASLFTGTHGDAYTALHHTGYSGQKLSDITRLDYATYSSQNPATVSWPALLLDLSTPNGLDELSFMPSQQTQSPVSNTWQSWNGLTGKWSSTFNFQGTIAAYLVAVSVTPGDVMIVNRSNGTGGLVLQECPASSTDVFDGYVDAFTIGINGADTTYDFEPDAPTTPTSTFTPTATFTITSTPTPTPTATATPCPGACPPTSTFTPTATYVGVGGIAEQPDVATLPSATASSGRNYSTYILGVAGVVLAALSASAWATWRRRRVR